MMAFGLPIFDRDGEVLYIFCSIGFLPDIKPREREVARLMQQAAADIHRDILGRPPAGFPA